MGHPRLGPDISRLSSEAVLTTQHIQKWRLEVRDQWSVTGCEIDPEEVCRSLIAWEGMGCEYGLLLYLVLGTEWLFRARKPTLEDLEEQLIEIETGFSKPLYPALTRVQSRLVVNALSSILVKELKKYRFLVSLNQWALPRPRLRLQDVGTADEGLEKPESVVVVKPGAIPNVGPMVVSILCEDILKADGQTDAESETLGRELARILLRREEIPSFERQRWRARLEDSPPDPEMSRRLLDPPVNLRQALRQRWTRSYEIAMSRAGWDGFMLDLSRDPRPVFEFAANLEVISMVYGIDWGTKDVPGRWSEHWKNEKGGALHD